ERRVASAAHVLAAKPGFEVWKHTCVMEGDNLLGHEKLFPEYRCALELLAVSLSSSRAQRYSGNNFSWPRRLSPSMTQVCFHTSNPGFAARTCAAEATRRSRSEERRVGKAEG